MGNIESEEQKKKAQRVTGEHLSAVEPDARLAVKQTTTDSVSTAGNTEEVSKNSSNPNNNDSKHVHDEVHVGSTQTGDVIEQCDNYQANHKMALSEQENTCTAEPQSAVSKHSTQSGNESMDYDVVKDILDKLVERLASTATFQVNRNFQAAMSVNSCLHTEEMHNDSNKVFALAPVQAPKLQVDVCLNKDDISNKLIIDSVANNMVRDIFQKFDFASFDISMGNEQSKGTKLTKSKQFKQSPISLSSSVHDTKSKSDDYSNVEIKVEVQDTMVVERIQSEATAIPEQCFDPITEDAVIQREVFFVVELLVSEVVDRLLPEEISELNIVDIDGAVSRNSLNFSSNYPQTDLLVTLESKPDEYLDNEDVDCCHKLQVNETTVCNHQSTIDLAIVPYSPGETEGLVTAPDDMQDKLLKSSVNNTYLDAHIDNENGLSRIANEIASEVIQHSVKQLQSEISKTVAEGLLKEIINQVVADIECSIDNVQMSCHVDDVEHRVTFQENGTEASSSSVDKEQLCFGEKQVNDADAFEQDFSKDILEQVYESGSEQTFAYNISTEESQDLLSVAWKSPDTVEHTSAVNVITESCDVGKTQPDCENKILHTELFLKKGVEKTQKDSSVALLDTSVLAEASLMDPEVQDVVESMILTLCDGNEPCRADNSIPHSTSENSSVAFETTVTHTDISYENDTETSSTVVTSKVSNDSSDSSHGGFLDPASFTEEVAQSENQQFSNDIINLVFDVEETLHSDTMSESGHDSETSPVGITTSEDYQIKVHFSSPGAEQQEDDNTRTDAYDGFDTETTNESQQNNKVEEMLNIEGASLLKAVSEDTVLGATKIHDEYPDSNTISTDTNISKLQKNSTISNQKNTEGVQIASLPLPAEDQLKYDDREARLAEKGARLLLKKQQDEAKALFKTSSIGSNSGVYNHSTTSSVSGAEQSVTATFDASGASQDLRNNVAQLEEKYKQAMVQAAQLDNERSQLQYQTQQLKDLFEEQEDNYYRLSAEHKATSQALERQKRAFDSLQRKYYDLQEALRQRDELIQEQGLVVVGETAHDGTAESDYVDDDYGRSRLALVTQKAAEVLESVGEGPLDSQLKALAEEKQALLDQVRYLKQELEDERRKKAVMNGSTEPVNAEARIPEMQLLEIQREANRQVNEYKLKLHQSEQDIAACQGNISRLESQLQRLKQTSEQYEKNEDEMRAEKRKLMRDLRQANDRIEEMEMTNSHLEKRLERIRASRAALGQT